MFFLVLVSWFVLGFGELAKKSIDLKVFQDRHPTKSLKFKQKSASDNAKIVNGIEVDNSVYPWIVSMHMTAFDDSGLYNTLYASHFCGASLISSPFITPPLVLTAAHCVDGLQDELDYYEDSFDEYYGGDWTFELTVDVGRTRVKNYPENKKDTLYDTIIVKNWHMHQDYDATNLQNDIAVMSLDDTVSSNLAPDATHITWDVSVTLQNDNFLRVIGYGTNESGGNLSPQLEYADIVYVDTQTCNDYQNLLFYLNETGVGRETYDWANPDFSVLNGWAGYENYILDGMICGWAENKDSCQGDSGGPVINNQTTEYAVQVGVVSWGFGCAWGTPGVYADVDYYRNWISGANACLRNEVTGLSADSTECNTWVSTYGPSNGRDSLSIKLSTFFSCVFVGILTSLIY